MVACALPALSVHRPAGIAPKPSILAEVGVIASALLAIGSVPALPLLLAWLLRRACRAEEGEQQRAWGAFAVALSAYLLLVFMPTVTRPVLVQTAPFRWWLEYLSVQVAYRTGEPLSRRQYVFLMMPHGLYPFSGACAAISKMVDIFLGMRIAVAPAALKVPIIRHLMAWIGCIPADKASIAAALRRGDSVCVFPGGIGEMLRTEGSRERLLLLSRRGILQAALEHDVPIVPVYVFGQSMLWSHLRLPATIEKLSRWLRVSLILPYGRFGLLVPRKLPLLYAVGAPISCPTPDDTPISEQVTSLQKLLVTAVRDLYDYYKSSYGWEDRQLDIE